MAKERKINMEVDNIEYHMIQEYRNLNFGEMRVEKNSKTEKTDVVTQERKRFIKGELVTPPCKKASEIHEKDELRHG